MKIVEVPCDCKTGPCGWKHFRQEPSREDERARLGLLRRMIRMGV